MREWSVEDCVVGSCMGVPEWYNLALQEGVEADWFSDSKCRALWNLFAELRGAGLSTDIVVVHDRLKGQPASEIRDLAFLGGMMGAQAPTRLSFCEYILVLRNKWLASERGKLWQRGKDARAANDVDSEQTAADGISRTFIPPNEPESLQSAAAAFAGELDRGTLPDFGLPTGLLDADRDLGTLQPGELVIVAARTGVGKSSFVRQVGAKVALDGRGVVMVSTEMGAREIAIAAARQQSGIPWNPKVTLPKPMADEFGAMVRKISVLSTFKLVEQKALSTMMARFSVLMETEFPPQLFVVDYIQQIDAAQQKGETLSSAIGRVSTALKAFALRHKVVVLAAAQLNRDSIKEGEPQLIHLRDSGSLEQDADRVLMMKLADDGDTASRYATVNLYQKKNRNGGEGLVKLTFDRWTTRFANHTQR